MARLDRLHKALVHKIGELLIDVDFRGALLLNRTFYSILKPLTDFQRIHWEFYSPHYGPSGYVYLPFRYAYREVIDRNEYDGSEEPRVNVDTLIGNEIQNASAEETKNGDYCRKLVWRWKKLKEIDQGKDARCFQEAAFVMFPDKYIHSCHDLDFVAKVIPKEVQERNEKAFIERNKRLSYRTDW